MISIHCVAHRLALAMAGSAKEVVAIGHCLETIDKVHSYFNKSGIRMAALNQSQVAKFASWPQLCTFSSMVI